METYNGLLVVRHGFIRWIKAGAEADKKGLQSVGGRTHGFITIDGKRQRIVFGDSGDVFLPAFTIATTDVVVSSVKRMFYLWGVCPFSD